MESPRTLSEVGILLRGVSERLSRIESTLEKQSSTRLQIILIAVSCVMGPALVGLAKFLLVGR